VELGTAEVADALDGAQVFDPDAAINGIRAFARPGHVVLVKASHGLGHHEVLQCPVTVGKPDSSDIGRSGGAS
jgi:UDP-N-acetylmuramyl pentapeptide synthase